jgi:hypothetical protein
MKKIKYIALFICIGFSSIVLVGCSGGSGGGSDGGTSPAVSGVLVDPFISGAVLCEDVDKSGTCDAGEQLSSTTDANGNFSFANDLTVGSHIIMSQQGFHNNVPYTLNLAGVVDADGNIDVVSPLTTLQTKSLTVPQIKGLLTAAGLGNLTDDDILANPLAGGINSLRTDNQLRRLHATLATYGMLKVIKGSKRLSELTALQLINSPEVNQILTAMVTTIKATLSMANLNVIQAQVDANNNAFFTAPTVSVNVITQTAVTTIDALTKIAYDTCNQTDGTDAQKVAAALAEMNSKKAAIIGKINAVGTQYYARENRNVFLALPAMAQAGLPAEIQAGINMANNAALVLSRDGNVSKQSGDVANFIMQGYADANTKAQATTVTECPQNPSEDQPNYMAGLDCDGDGGVVAFETPRSFKVAFKSMGLVNQAGEKLYLFNKPTLQDSIVFDITNPKDLGEMTIPQGTYTHVFAELYYYWLDMQMYNQGQYTQFRVYMSDDNRTHATAGHHQGDVTITDINNTEVGFLSPGGKWLESQAVPNRDNNAQYASTDDPDTSRKRGPYGNDTLWNNEALNPNDVFTVSQAINLNLTKESRFRMTFKVKDNWYWEDYNGDGIFGPSEHNNTTITEAADANATWSPLLGFPDISIVE